MIKLYTQNSLHPNSPFNHSFFTSSTHTNQPIKHIFTNLRTKNRTQSFISINKPHQTSNQQLQLHQINNSSFNQSFTSIKNKNQYSLINNKKQPNKYSQRQSYNQTKKSSTKHNNQKITHPFIYQSKQKIKGAIKKNKINQNISYQSNQTHLKSIDSNQTHLKSIDSNKEKNKLRKKQNRTQVVKKVQQNQNLKIQDNIKTDFQQRSNYIQLKKKKTLQQDQNQQNIQTMEQQIFQKENLNPNIDKNQVQKINDMTSKRISQLQSRSETIDLLKFTIKTKLSKDILDDSQNCFNSLMSSDNKNSHRQYIEEILKLKDLQANFYIDKITSLQNQLNKTRKQRKSIEQEIYIKCDQNNRKNLIEKLRFEQENELLKRQNQALRTIILKKINNRQSF